MASAEVKSPQGSSGRPGGGLRFSPPRSPRRSTLEPITAFSSTGEERGVRLEAPGTCSRKCLRELDWRLSTDQLCHTPRPWRSSHGASRRRRQETSAKSSCLAPGLALVRLGNVDVHFNCLSFFECEVELRSRFQHFLQMKCLLNNQFTTKRSSQTLEIFSSFLTPWKWSCSVTFMSKLSALSENPIPM